MIPRNTVNQPLVSVVIPTYNYGHFVLSAIESIRKQDYTHIEIIVIDDGSTDNTPQIVSSLPDITYIRQENQGLSAARNHGIRLATGKYLQFLDADDLLGPNSIHRRVNFLEANLEYSSVICRSAFFYKHVYPEKLAPLYHEWPQPETGQTDLAMYYFNIAPPHSFLVRKSAVETHTLEFDTRLRACEDYDFWFRLALVSGVPGVVRSCWVYYRQHTNSMSRSYVNQYQHDAELCKRIRTLVTDANPWLGSRPRGDYLAAMFAASVLTARRLWKVDRPSFDGFLSNHVLPLQQQLEVAQQGTSVTLAALWYQAQARHTLLRMWLRDHSLTQVQHERLCRSVTMVRSFFLSAFTGGNKPISTRTFVRLLWLDVLYIMVRLLFSHRRHSGIIPGSR